MNIDASILPTQAEARASDSFHSDFFGHVNKSVSIAQKAEAKAKMRSPEGTGLQANNK